MAAVAKDANYDDYDLEDDLDDDDDNQLDSAELA